MSPDDQSVSRRQFVKRSATTTAALALAPSLAAGCKPGDQNRAPRGGTYTLDIMFTGLCLFALDADKHLRVLLPAAGANVPPHEVRLYSDGWDIEGIKVPGTFVAEILSADREAILDFRDGLLNFTEIWGTHVDNKLFEGVIAPDVLTARVKSTGGYFSRTGSWRGIWNTTTPAPKELTLAPWAIWTTEVEVAVANDQPLVLTPPLPSVKLNVVPQSGRNVLIEVRHAPANEQGSKPTGKNEPQPDEPSEHFPAYGKLFNPPLNAALKWKDDIGTPPAAVDRGINPYTCMTGGGDG